MIAEKLTAQNFRNLSDVSFEPCRNVNVLCGNNAQGKTNLIEALWLFSGVRSFRSSKDSQLISFGENNARLSLDFSSENMENHAEINISERKTLELNGVKSERTTSLAGKFCEVVFSPDHLSLVKQGPSQRRKFIDFAITEILPRYGAALSEYTKILKQRNALLKDIQYDKSLKDMIPVWDDKLVKVGAQIIFTRLRYLKRLSSHAVSVYSGIAESSNEEKKDLSKEKETLSLSYTDEFGETYTDNISSAAAALPLIQEKLKTAVEKSLVSDIAAGHTGAGPHHDDILIEIGKKNARLYSSQGQQRSAVLALKLAEAKVVEESVGEPPILLLDDVMSELDSGRKNYILNNIGSLQVFITCCETSGLENLEGGKIFKVESGTVKEL